MKVLNRAKSLDSMGDYIISQSIKFEKGRMYLYSIPFRQWVESDESTRSINFEDMIDSQGNKIFASLSKDRKGGDILDISGRTETIFIDDGEIQTYMFKWDDLKDFKKQVIGIQK